jgi:hypothetical protein
VTTRWINDMLTVSMLQWSENEVMYLLGSLEICCLYSLTTLGNQRSKPHTDYFVLSSFPSNGLLIECLVFPECDRNFFHSVPSTTVLLSFHPAWLNGLCLSPSGGVCRQGGRDGVTYLPRKLVCVVIYTWKTVITFPVNFQLSRALVNL